jgi:hypothetical protein
MSCSVRTTLCAAGRFAHDGISAGQSVVGNRPPEPGPQLVRSSPQLAPKNDDGFEQLREGKHPASLAPGLNQQIRRGLDRGVEAVGNDVEVVVE